MLIIDPDVFCRCGIASFVNLNWPVRFTSSMSFQSASSISCSFFILGNIPALFTRISSLPNFAIVLLRTFLTSGVFRISAAMPMALGIFDAAFSSLLLSLAVIATVAPFSDRIFAVANPIPRLPPVTSATLPESLNNIQKGVS